MSDFRWIEMMSDQSKYPIEMSRPYAGQHVAWRLDGTEIIASDPDLDKLFEKLKGINPSDVCLQYVLAPGECEKIALSCWNDDLCPPQ